MLGHRSVHEQGTIHLHAPYDLISIDLEFPSRECRTLSIASGGSDLCTNNIEPRSMRRIYTLLPNPVFILPNLGWKYGVQHLFNLRVTVI